MKRRGKEKNFSKKRKILDEILKPIPFVPPDLDFSRHEKLLKRLGLWDFVHLEFDRSLRTDLLSQLIASYGDRCSYVNGARINVSRADLARALKLPVKKDKDTVARIDGEAGGLLRFGGVDYSINFRHEAPQGP